MKKTKQMEEMLLEHFRKTPIVEAVCQKAGISRMTLSRWKRDDTEFSKKVDAALLEGRLLVNDLAENQLIAAIQERNMTAIALWLRHNHRAYRERID